MLAGIYVIWTLSNLDLHPADYIAASRLTRWLKCPQRDVSLGQQKSLRALGLKPEFIYDTDKISSNTVHWMETSLTLHDAGGVQTTVACQSFADVMVGKRLPWGQQWNE